MFHSLLIVLFFFCSIFLRVQPSEVKNVANKNESFDFVFAHSVLSHFGHTQLEPFFAALASHLALPGIPSFVDILFCFICSVPSSRTDIFTSHLNNLTMVTSRVACRTFVFTFFVIKVSVRMKSAVWPF